MRTVFAVSAVNIPSTEKEREVGGGQARVRKTINRPTIKSCHLRFLEMDKYFRAERRREERFGRKLYLFILLEKRDGAKCLRNVCFESGKERWLAGYNNEIMILDHGKFHIIIGSCQRLDEEIHFP